MSKESDKGERWGGDFLGPHAWSSIYSSRRQGGLKKWVLWLLSERSLRGSEIIEAMAKQSMGWWKPSPGTIYPLLHQLEGEGFVIRKPDSKYEITDPGLEEIGLKFKTGYSREDSDLSLDDILANLEGYVDYLEDEKDKLSEEHRKRLREVEDRLKKL